MKTSFVGLRCGRAARVPERLASLAGATHTKWEAIIVINWMWGRPTEVNGDIPPSRNRSISRKSVGAPE